MSKYLELSDEEKLEQAIKFVAIGQPIPTVLEAFLKEQALYDLIVNPGGRNEPTTRR